MPISDAELAAATVAAAPAGLVRDATTRRPSASPSVGRYCARCWLVSVQVTTRSIIRERLPAAT